MQKAEVRRLQERCRISEGHAKLAKQQLARSDQQRIEGQQQLEKLKQDFMDLKRMLPKRSGSSIGATPLSARAHGSNSAHGAPRTLFASLLELRTFLHVLAADCIDSVNCLSFESRTVILVC